MVKVRGASVDRCMQQGGNNHQNDLHEIQDQASSQVAALTPEGQLLHGDDRTDTLAKQEGAWVPTRVFECPLTGRLFSDPYMTPSGNNYEREAIEQEILETGRSPETKQQLQMSDIVPNKGLKRVVSELQHPKTPPKKNRLMRGFSSPKERMESTHAKYPDLDRDFPIVHFLHASPLVIGPLNRSLQSLNLREELQCLQSVNYVRCQVATVKSLQEALVARNHPKIVHVSAHATGEALLLENADGSARSVGMDEFAAVGPWKTVSLLLFLACYSDKLVERLKALWMADGGPEYVVCCNGDVQDAAARLYSSAFYNALAAAHEIPTCHSLAQQAVRSRKPVLRLQADRFILLPFAPTANRDCMNHHASLKLFQDDVSELLRIPKESSIENYRGHNGMMFQIGWHFQQRRTIALWAEQGMGKTALCKAVTRHFSALPGRLFAASAFYVDIADAYAAYSHDTVSVSGVMVLKNLLVAEIRKHIGNAPAKNRECVDVDLRCLIEAMDRLNKPWLVAVDGFSRSNFAEFELSNMINFLAGLQNISCSLYLMFTTDSRPSETWVDQYSKICGVKLCDMKVRPLEEVDAAMLFLLRSRRSLCLLDFPGRGQASSVNLRESLPTGIRGDNQGALDLLMNSPIMAKLGGVPGRIVAAAAQVTEDLSTLEAHPLLQEPASAVVPKTYTNTMKCQAPWVHARDA